MQGFAAQEKPRAERRRSLLQRTNTAIASPIANLVAVLGFTPGQLSLQSLTITIVGLLRMADGTYFGMATGAAIVYFALLLDRADLLLSQRKGKVSPWTSFMGVAIDRLVEVALLVGLGVLAVRGVHGSPIPPLELLSTGWILVLGTATAGLMMIVKTLSAYSEVHLLRHHLLTTRRLPGPSIIPRTRPAFAVIEPLAGRDETILVWCIGILLGQLDLTLIVMMAMQLLLVVERIVLFRLRLKDPEVEASRILGPDYL